MDSSHPIPDRPARIVLVGFMGAGKSTAGPLLAERLGWRFIDADVYLEQETGSTITALFAASGEAEFRRMEAAAIAQLQSERELVLALGGGALESDATRQLFSEDSDTCMVFLQAPLEVLIDRCERQAGNASRPVLNQRAALGERFHSRQMHYQAAHITVNTPGIYPTSVVDLILEGLKERYPAAPLSLKAVSI